MQKNTEKSPCWELAHKHGDFSVFFYRAKPATEVERSGTEVHCGVEVHCKVKLCHPSKTSPLTSSCSSG